MAALPERSRTDMPHTPPTKSRSARQLPDSSAPVLLEAEVAGRLRGLVAAFSTALPRVPDARLAPQLQRLAAGQWGRAPEGIPRPLLLRQTHSPDVLELNDDESLPGKGSPSADGAASVLGPARLLAVKTADCVPLLAVDAELGRYAALHAGWRGTAAGILPRLLAAWRAAGSSLRSVHLELGPHIQGCCYEVQADCLAQFEPAELREAVRGGPEHTHLHLAAVLRTQALAAGVPPAQVQVWTHCTYCHREADGTTPYASYRRASHTGQPFAGTNVGLIGLLAPP
ncbi:MAG TPA: polyphenol oxidase family protein [bacterium]|nr:polyphenol oxidase family protein [bacterium]